MRKLARTGLVAVPLALTGCLGDRADRDNNAFAFRNPFADRKTAAVAPDANARLATRVHAVGSEVVAANAGQLKSKPTFLTIGLKEPMIFHQKAGLVVLSEGLVDRCGTDAELAAAICFELGKMDAGHEDRSPLKPERELPPSPPLPADSMGGGRSADMTREAEIAMMNHRSGPSAKTRAPRPDPKLVAEGLLVKAGHKPDELTRLDSLLREAEENGDKREIMRGR